MMLFSNTQLQALNTSARQRPIESLLSSIEAERQEFHVAKQRCENKLTLHFLENITPVLMIYLHMFLFLPNLYRLTKELLETRAELSRERKTHVATTTDLQRQVEVLRRRLDKEGEVAAESEAQVRRLRDERQQLSLRLVNMQVRKIERNRKKRP